MRILLVEDEIKIAQFTAQALSAMGYVVEISTTGKRSRELFTHTSYDLVILDIMLPDDNGIELCASFKQQRPSTPVLMLTTLGQIHEKVQGLDSGADDYMTKPFHVEELTARVRALFRRHQEQDLALTCADLKLDLIKRVAHRKGETIKLTTKEFALLEYFLRNVGRPLSRAQIAQHVWDLHFDPESNVVDAYVKQLRKKIDQHHQHRLIKTVIGLGYVLNSE